MWFKEGIIIQDGGRTQQNWREKGNRKTMEKRDGVTNLAGNFRKVEEETIDRYMLYRGENGGE